MATGAPAGELPAGAWSAGASWFGGVCGEDEVAMGWVCNAILGKPRLSPPLKNLTIF